MTGKIWAFLAMVGGVLIGVLKVFSMGKKAAANEIKANQEAAARDIERRASGAVIDGIENEKEAKNAPVDTNKRDHFKR